MYTDIVIIAGIGTVGLMVAFLGAFAYFVWKFDKDNDKQK
ncbi:cytochrome c oxidase subunit CcoM [Pseudomonas sp. F1_0610]